jgi:N-methylhydantoinase A
MAVEETALGIIRVACATMVKAIRTVSVERGLDPAEFTLFPFGGAGPLHAVEVARQLDMTRVLVPLNPGILCAEGALNSMQTIDLVASLLAPFEDAALDVIAAAARRLDARATSWFAQEDVAAERQRIAWTADLRYFGQNYEIAVALPDRELVAADLPAIIASFHRQHETLYGFASATERIQIVNLKAKATCLVDLPPIAKLPARAAGKPHASRRIVFERDDAHATPIFRRADLAPGQAIAGPAVIDQLDATTLVFPGDRLVVDPCGNLVLALGGTRAP